MERIDILKELGVVSIEDAINSKKIIPFYEASTEAYWVNLEDKYLFKELVEPSYLYRSLLTQKIFMSEGIEVTTTFYGRLGKMNGELVLDYRVDGFSYVSGADILDEYQKYLEENSREVPKNMNNLETILEALNFHFRKYKTRDSIVFNIMEEMKKRFIMDFITMQTDRYKSNWEISENAFLGKAKLTPSFDNNKSFLDMRIRNGVVLDYSSGPFLMKLDPLKDSTGDCYHKFETFLDVNDSKWTLLFISMLEDVTPIKISIYLEQLGLSSTNEVRCQIEKNYQNHYEEMTKILERRKGLGR